MESAQVKINTITLYLTIAVLVFVLIVIGLIILILFMINPSSTKTCSAQICGSNSYCNGLGECIFGTAQAEKQLCSTSNDCAFGLKCVQNQCLPSNSPLNGIPVAPHSNFVLSTTTSGNVTKYLNLNSTKSVLSTTLPNDHFRYTPKNEELQLNGKYVDINSNGYLIASVTPSQLELIQQPDGSIYLIHPCGQILSTEALKTIDDGPAFFPGGISACPSTWTVSNTSQPIKFRLEDK